MYNTSPFMQETHTHTHTPCTLSAGSNPFHAEARSLCWKHPILCRSTLSLLEASHFMQEHALSAGSIPFHAGARSLCWKHPISCRSTLSLLEVLYSLSVEVRSLCWKHPISCSSTLSLLEVSLSCRSTLSLLEVFPFMQKHALSAGSIPFHAEACSLC